jgi:hypothetical protein
MSKTTTIQAISNRTGVKPRQVLSALPGFGVTGKHKYSNKIDKSISSKLEDQLTLPYDELEYKGPRKTVFDEFEAHSDDTFELEPERITESPLELGAPSPTSDIAEDDNAKSSELDGSMPMPGMRESFHVVELLDGMTSPEKNTIPAPYSQGLFAESLHQASISNIDRFVEVIEKASSNELADLVERNNRLRCLENFEILHKVLAEIGIPSGTVIHDRDYNEWGELRFSVYQRILLNALGYELVRKLELQSLLYTAKQYRDSIAHLDIFHLSAEATKWIADRVQMLTVDLMVCHKVCAAEVDDLWSENPADSFYEFFKIHQALHCLGDEAVL